MILISGLGGTGGGRPLIHQLSGLIFECEAKAI
jgi:hypothetical protein